MPVITRGRRRARRVGDAAPAARPAVGGRERVVAAVGDGFAHGRPCRSRRCRPSMRRTVQRASTSADDPGTDSKRCTSMATRKSASSAVVCASRATRGVASSGAQVFRDGDAMPSASGEAQRLNSSSQTSLSLIVTTISGRSTTAGIATGPDDDRQRCRAAVAAGGGGAAQRVEARRRRRRASRPRAQTSCTSARRREAIDGVVISACGSCGLAPDQRLRVAFEVVGEHAQAARRAAELLHRVAQLRLARRAGTDEVGLGARQHPFSACAECAARIVERGLERGMTSVSKR